MGKVGSCKRLWGRRAQIILLALAPSDETLPDLIILLEKKEKRGGARERYTTSDVPDPVINVPEQSFLEKQSCVPDW
jgi:hypothetical protein